eukprot:s2837_g9.t1
MFLELPLAPMTRSNRPSAGYRSCRVQQSLQTLCFSTSFVTQGQRQCAVSVGGARYYTMGNLRWEYCLIVPALSSHCIV